MTALMLALALSAAAPEKKSEPKTVIVFGEDLIESTALKPDVDITLIRNSAKFKRLIKVRENFDDKIIRSVDQM